MSLGSYESEVGRGNLLNALAHPSVINPAAAMGQAAQTANALYNLRQNQANQAIGGILQQATDPQGNVDYGKANALAGQAGPVVQMGMQTMLANNAARRGQQLVQTNQHMANIGAAALTIVNDPSDANLAQVRTSLLNAGYPQGVVDQEIGTMQGMDAGQRRAYAMQHGLAAMDAGGRMAAAIGSTGVANMPQGMVPYFQGGILQGGRMETAPGGIPSGQQVTYPDQTGTTQYGTAASYAGARGVPVPGSPNAPGAPSTINQPRLPQAGQRAALPIDQAKAQAAQTGQEVPILNGNGLVAQPNGNVGPSRGAAGGAAQAVTPQPATRPPQATGLTETSGPAPGAVQSSEASANQYNAARADAGNFQQRVWPLVQAAHILDTNAPTTGAGAEAARSIIGHLQTFGTVFSPADLQSIGQAKFEELGKYLQQAVNSSPFAASSNDKLAAAITGSPNTHISNLANKDVVKAMIGQERMKLAAFTDFQNSGQPPNQFANFQATWARTHDPRAFMTDMLDDDHLKKMFAAMSPAERQSFAASHKLIEINPEIMNQAAMP